MVEKKKESGFKIFCTICNTAYSKGSLSFSRLGKKEETSEGLLSIPISYIYLVKL